MSGASGTTHFCFFSIITLMHKPTIGKHPCLWCLIESDDLIKPLSVRGRSPSRTLESLSADYREFCEKGGGDKKKAIIML